MQRHEKENALQFQQLLDESNNKLVWCFSLPQPSRAYGLLHFQGTQTK